MRELNLEQQTTLALSLGTWGAYSQVGMAYEEMGELITALNQYDRKRITAKEVATELADVYIMLNQIELLLDCHADVEDEITRKMERLKGRVAAAQKAKLEQV